MTETVLILGPNGRFGRAAVAAFAAAGWNVRLWLRPGAAAPAGYAAHHGDIYDAPALAQAAKGADVVINALNPPYHHWAAELPRMTAAVIDAARSAGATIIIPGNVYNFGAAMPEVLTETTPHIGDHKKASLRIMMEEAYRDSGVPTIILRGGDFIEGAKTGNWFDSHITKSLGKGRIAYPGPLDRAHAWAYLPDMARAAAMLAARRSQMKQFQTIGFPGYTLTGQQLIDALAGVTNTRLAASQFPWWALCLLAPFAPLIREVVDMRYLWNQPHQIDGAAFTRFAPDFTPTLLKQALAASLPGLNLLPGEKIMTTEYQDFVAV